jgi:hypothetical protein
MLIVIERNIQEFKDKQIIKWMCPYSTLSEYGRNGSKILNLFCLSYKWTLSFFPTKTNLKSPTM